MSCNRHDNPQLSLQNPPNAFNTFSADQFLQALAIEGGINIADGLSVWDQPASEAAAVRDGLITNVPPAWTYGQLMVHCMKQRVGSQAVQLSVAKVAIYKAHEATCLARAAAATAEARRQEARDSALAATHTIQELDQEAMAGVEGSDDATAVRDAIDRAEDASKALELASDAVVAGEQRADELVREAETAIQSIPSPARETYVATLAPDFAHLAGDMVNDGTGHPSKPSFDGVPADLFGFVCTGCKVYNLVRSGEKKWYVVYVGSKVGIFHGNHRAMQCVTGVRGAVQRGFFTIEEAEGAFASALMANIVRVVE